MTKSKLTFLLICISLIFNLGCKQEKRQSKEINDDERSFEIPHLIKQETSIQLIVDDKPFIVLGGELGNSSFTSVEYMKPVWPKLKAMNLNTFIAPVYWEIIEPEEGHFDFELFDQLVDEARNHNLRIVVLWFASWKNSMSSHVPSWVKKNQERFPRVKDDQGQSHEILTPLSENNLEADLKAYRALMEHIKEINSKEQTIIMIQTENEIGMLPVARDYSTLANKIFHENVPKEFTDYLLKNKDHLVPEFHEVWGKYGFKTSGTWEDIFGNGSHTDEIFMAWYYSKFTNAIIEAGKEIYPLPMYVNAALNRPNREPGKGYPSAGPLPHIMDVWLAGGKSIDFLAPDFYFPNIEYWCDLYTRQNNPLFIPEHRFDNTVAAKALFTIGHYESLGFAPFSIESKNEPENEDLGKAYQLINQMIPMITSKRVLDNVDGFLLDKEKQQTVRVFGNYEFTISHSNSLGYSGNLNSEVWEPAGAIIIQTGEGEFYLLGSGVVITFKNLKNPSKIVGILKDEEGYFENNNWKVLRHLNGDQTHQGRHIRIFLGDYSIQRFELYNYD